MSSFEKHCEESEKLFGDRFEDLHQWLDAFAGTEEYGMRHRKKRHHKEGIRQATRLFGEIAGKAARQHIISDLKEEGWTEQDSFPGNEADYIKMGLF